MSASEAARGPWLLRRERRDVHATIEHLVGMQSQVPGDPFIGLWSRIDGFDPADLDRLMLERKVVRTGLFRTTLHLVTAEDAVALAPIFAGVLARTFRSQRAFREAVDGLDLDALVARGAAVIAEEPRTPADVARILGEPWPDRDAQAIGLTVRHFVPIVQVTPRGLFGRSHQPTITTLAAWLDHDVATEPDPAVLEALLRRYLAAFGPATVSDARTWSWLTDLRAAFDRIRPSLRTYRDERGRELLDLEEATIVDASVEAPVRFLPEYDNLLLSHDDRSRMAGSWYPDTSRSRGSVLVDGFVAAGWHVERVKGAVTLLVDCFTDVDRADREAVEAEGTALLAFRYPDANERRVEITRFEA